MKILLAGYYGYADGYLAGAKGLIDLGHELSFFPLMTMIHKKYSIDDLINVLNGNSLSYENLKKKYSEYVNDSPDIKPDICLWWQPVPQLSVQNLAKIKNQTSCKFIQLNWDPSAIIETDHKEHISSFRKCVEALPFFNKILVVNSKLINHLQKYNRYNIPIKHFYPGHHESTSFYNENKEYACDISIICTNLYEDLNLWKGTKICRKHIVDAIYSRKDIDFHFYGPERFKTLYPRAYKGFIKYGDCNKVFSNSKINLNISPVGDSLNEIINGEKRNYMSERCPQILACKGLMICETDLTPLLVPGKDYIKIDNVENFIKLIPEILKNDEEYNKIRESGYQKALKHLRWEDTLKIIF